MPQRRKKVALSSTVVEEAAVPADRWGEEKAAAFQVGTIVEGSEGTRGIGKGQEDMMSDGGGQLGSSVSVVLV